MVHILLAVIYLSFISLGLPDSLLGSAWPLIYPELGVSVSNAGIIAIIISCCTIVSSLMSAKLLSKMGTGLLTALSTLVSVIGLFGFGSAGSLLALCLWALPYGLGAGCIDTALNNYVALHYPSRHMNWLHCMWGVGTSIGPYIFGFALSGSSSWHAGYAMIGTVQAVLCAVTFISLPLWKKTSNEKEDTTSSLSLRDALRLRGAKQMMLTLFCYCAIEQTAGLWASSYLVLERGIAAERAVFFGSLFSLFAFFTLFFGDSYKNYCKLPKIIV